MTQLDIEPSFLVCIALGVIIIPIQWIAAWCVAVFVHELFHYVAIRLCSKGVYYVRLGVFGAVMESAPLTLGQEWLCAFAGPLGSLSLLLFSKWIPRTAILGVIQAAYNFLPLFPMDGGRMFRCLLLKILPVEKSHMIEKIVGQLVKLLLFLFGLYMSMVLHFGVIPICMLLVVIVKNIKIPCKESQQRVQ